MAVILRGGPAWVRRARASDCPSLRDGPAGGREVRAPLAGSSGRRLDGFPGALPRRALSEAGTGPANVPVRPQRALCRESDDSGAARRRVRGPSTVRGRLTLSVRLTRRKLSVTAAMRALAGAELGGVVLFAGRVRPDPTPRGPVVALDYEAHRALAIAALTGLERTARRRFGAEKVVLWHRLGPIPVGEPSVLVGVATGHRAEAFAAARFLIERLKAEAPIWKVERARPARRPRSRPGGPVGR